MEHKYSTWMLLLIIFIGGIVVLVDALDGFGTAKSIPKFIYGDVLGNSSIVDDLNGSLILTSTICTSTNNLCNGSGNGTTVINNTYYINYTQNESKFPVNVSLIDYGSEFQASICLFNGTCLLSNNVTDSTGAYDDSWIQPALDLKRDLINETFTNIYVENTTKTKYLNLTATGGGMLSNLALNDYVLTGTGGIYGLRISNLGLTCIGCFNSSIYSKLEVHDDATGEPRGFNVYQHNTGVQGPAIQFLKSRGAVSTPSAISAGDYLGIFQAYGYNGTNYRRSAQFGFITSGSIGSIGYPTDIIFDTTTPNGSTFTRMMTIKSNGSVIFTGNLLSNNSAVCTNATGCTIAVGVDYIGSAYGNATYVKVGTTCECSSTADRMYNFTVDAEGVCTAVCGSDAGGLGSSDGNNYTSSIGFDQLTLQLERIGMSNLTATLSINYSNVSNTPDLTVYNDSLRIDNLNTTKLDVSDQRFNETLYCDAGLALKYNASNPLNFINDTYGNATYYLASNPSNYIDDGNTNWDNTYGFRSTDQNLNTTHNVRFNSINTSYIEIYGNNISVKQIGFYDNASNDYKYTLSYWGSNISKGVYGDFYPQFSNTFAIGYDDVPLSYPIIINNNTIWLGYLFTDFATYKPQRGNVDVKGTLAADTLIGGLNASNITNPYWLNRTHQTNTTICDKITQVNWTNGVLTAACGTDATGGGGSVNNTVINVTAAIVQNLINASCDVKANSDGSLYCGTDATGGASGLPIINYTYLAANVSTNLTSYTDLNMNFTLQASSLYIIECSMMGSSNTAASAVRFKFNITGTPVETQQSCETSTSATAGYQAGSATRQLLCASTAMIGANTPTPTRYTATVLMNGATGVFNIGMYGETANPTNIMNYTVMRGSTCTIKKLT